MNDSNFDKLLLSAEKPSRYIGAEVNSIHKNNAEVRFLLAFPDTYEVGMSHLGLQILYSILNDVPYVAAERCFAPWPDREKQLRDGKLPLTSLESLTPLADFDLIGFSLQYELSYTNVLNMLDLGGIPLARIGRKDGHPLIIAGGPCCFNPAPLVDFIDAFVIGEGEEVVAKTDFGKFVLHRLLRLFLRNTHSLNEGSSIQGVGISKHAGEQASKPIHANC